MASVRVGRSCNHPASGRSCSCLPMPGMCTPRRMRSMRRFGSSIAATRREPEGPTGWPQNCTPLLGHGRIPVRPYQLLQASQPVRASIRPHGTMGAIQGHAISKGGRRCQRTMRRNVRLLVLNERTQTQTVRCHGH